VIFTVRKSIYEIIQRFRNRQDYIEEAGPMLQWFFLSLKYHVWPLPKDAAQLRKLAINLQVPHAYTRPYTRFDISVVQSNILERLQSFKEDTLYVLLLLLPIFSIAAILLFSLHGA